MAHDYAHISLHDALEESAPGNEAVGAVVDGACDWATGVCFTFFFRYVCLSWIVSARTAEETEFSLAPHLEEIDKIFSRDSVEDILDALQQSRSHFGKQTLKAMRKASPLSLKVSYCLAYSCTVVFDSLCFRFSLFPLGDVPRSPTRQVSVA